MIRLMIVDDHELLRLGLRQIFSEYNDIEVVAEAGDGDTAIRLCREVRPNVVVLDVSLPGLSGFELTRRLRAFKPAVTVIALSVHDASPYPERMMEAGASGYLTKGCTVSELLQAIRTVARGGRHIGSAIAQKLILNGMEGHNGTPFDSLSAREMEVLVLLSEGHRLSEIADTMHLSPKTVATYKYRIFEKLETRNDVEMTRLAMRYGIGAPA
ncbi:MAG TPA: response regulator [Xanthomonadales bacterium]|nr:response regulator [Xanthomonadales bacterium]